MGGHYVVKRDDGWYVLNRDGDAVAGPYTHEILAQAEARRRGE